MRLLFGLILWVGTPLYWLSALGVTFSDNAPKFDLGAALLMTALAVGMAIGEWTRYQQRARRDAAAKAQQDFWLGQRK